MSATARFDAIGVVNQVTVLDEEALPAALSLAQRRIAELDAACSRFRNDSELERLNADGRAVVSPLLLEAIDAALWAAEETGGLVDPTVGGAMRALGYDRDFDLIVRTGAQPVFEFRPVVGWRSVDVDRGGPTVRLRGGSLDLGATAKALIADRIAAAAHHEAGTGVLVSCGGDIAVAGAAPDGGWPIRIAADHRVPEPSAPVVAIRSGGIATSSTRVRRWRAGDEEMHHIVDPATGRPAPETWRTVTCAAASCLRANAAATAGIVLGPAAPDWLEARAVPARLVAADGGVVRIAGWPENG